MQSFSGQRKVFFSRERKSFAKERFSQHCLNNIFPPITIVSHHHVPLGVL